MRRLLSKIVVMFVLICSMVISVSAADEEISVYFDGTKIEFDVYPQIINGRTMVPIRAIFEKMGASVEWDEGTNTAICTKDNTVVKMTVNSTIMYVNDRLVPMDVSPVIVDGRTLAPARYVAEAFGATVQWSQRTNTVVICSKDVYAYADYPDIPDVGKCYNIPMVLEQYSDGVRGLGYLYSDMSNDDYYGYLFDNSAFVLGEYSEEVFSRENGFTAIQYVKPGEDAAKFYIYVENCGEYMVFVVVIPDEAYGEEKTTVYALDGRTLEVAWKDVEAYLTVGWYRTLEETQQVMYASDGRTITVYKAEVSAYKGVGWYETAEAAQKANYTYNSGSSHEDNNPSADGHYYRTPTGKKYHLDPNCGGKNSYRTTNISGLSPCSKCAY